RGARRGRFSSGPGCDAHLDVEGLTMRTRLAALALALLYGLLLAPLAQAQAPSPGLPAVNPGGVGLSGERLGQLSAALKNDIEKGLIPGATLLVARHGKIAWFEAMGTRDPASRR